jgi:hypothetical protein
VAQQSQENRVDHRSAVMWTLVAAVGFLGGWVLHDELNTPAAASPPAAVAGETGQAPAVTEADSAAAAAPPTVVPVVVAITWPPTPDPTGSTPSPSAPIVVGGAPVAGQPGSPPASTARAPHPTARPSVSAAPAQPAGGATVSTWNVVVANDGSVVLMGSHGRLLANTGSPSQGATIALDTDGSTIETGDSGVAVVPGVPGVPGAPGAPGGTLASTGTVSSAAGAGGAAAVPLLPVADFEDHSVHVVGNDQIVTNDDSNGFINRDGQINSNTGDTDSSAINALDVTDSRIRSGSSAGIEDEPAEDEFVATGAGEVEPTPAPAPAPPGGATSLPGTSLPAGAADADAEDDPVGAEVHDKSVHSTGTRNAVTQDDSSLVMGGTGHVNAQAGDSDTAGIVAMGVHGSDLESGCAGTSCGAAGTP